MTRTDYALSQMIEEYYRRLKARGVDIDSIHDETWALVRNINEYARLSTEGLLALMQGDGSDGITYEELAAVMLPVALRR